MKQLEPACSQLVQKPFALSFQMPTFVFPDCARGCRIILPSGVKVIVNLVPPGEAALKGWPLKNVAFMSFGAIDWPAKAALALWNNTTITNDVARIKAPKAPMPKFINQHTPQSRKKTPDRIEALNGSRPFSPETLPDHRQDRNRLRPPAPSFL